MVGLLVLLGALGATAAIAVLLSWKNGRFTAPDTGTDDDGRVRLTPEQIGAPLGPRATMVQFSSAFCSPCRATRVLLQDVARVVPGVVTIEIDAETNLQLVRDLDIMRTPTVLVLDATGVVTTRASGLPKRDQVMAALGQAVDAGQ